MTTAAPLPLVSIIMAVRNEEHFIGATLSAVIQQDYPHSRMEIIIADGMSTDNTRTAIKELQRAHRDVPLRVVDNPGRIVARGLNVALQHCHGEIVIRVDGHTQIAKDYVRCCVALLRNTGAANVGGRMDPVGASSFGKCIAIATTTPFGIGGGSFHCSNTPKWVDTVYMGAWWRRTFDCFGYFDEELLRNQDDELNCRLRKYGGKIWLDPSIQSMYATRGSPGELWRQYFQYGVWKVRVMQKHPRQAQPRQFVPPLLVAVLLTSAGVSIINSAIGIPVFVLAGGSYCVVNVAASFWTGRHEGIAHLLRLPVVYGILHLSYGLGVLVGLVRFAKKWGDREYGPAQAVKP